MNITLFCFIDSIRPRLQGVVSAIILSIFLTGVGQGAGSCDLNLDGQVNVVDVQVALNQSLGMDACSTADVNVDGNCNVVDVQLVINTALGSNCPAPSSPGGSPQAPGVWVTNFTPTRVHYVDDVSCGGNGSFGSPECPNTAFSSSHYQCGDMHVFRQGTYLDNDLLEPNKDCTSSRPAVWKGYVGSDGQPERVVWRGAVRPDGAWHWFVNIEGTDPTPSSERSFFNIRAAGVRVINSVIHDVEKGSNIQPWSFGPGQVIYGNVTYRPGCGDPKSPPHNYYTTNDFGSYGYKYFVQNISVETNSCEAPRRLFQAYDGHGDRGTSGYHLENNFFGDAPGSTGNTVIWNNPNGTPSDKNVVKNNYFVDFFHSTDERSSVRLGMSNAWQGVLTGNYFAKANIVPEGFWGSTNPHDPLVFTGNEIYDPPGGTHIRRFQTRASSGAVGSHRIQNADVWNNNTYGGTFRAELHCNGTNYGNRTLSQWRSGTGDCRVSSGSNGFDLSSSVVPNPTTNKVAVLLNEYQCASCVFKDQQRGNVYVVNWTGAASQSANLSPVVGAGKRYVVRYARDFFGTPAASGTCPGAGACTVNLPTRRTSGESAGRFANAYVITAEP